MQPQDSSSSAWLCPDLFAYFLQAALSNKRKTIKFNDIMQAVSKDKRWEAAGLRDLLAHDEMFLEARAGPSTVKTKQVEQDRNAQQITAFFKA